MQRDADKEAEGRRPKKRKKKEQQKKMDHKQPKKETRKERRIAGLGRCVPLNWSCGPSQGHQESDSTSHTRSGRSSCGLMDKARFRVRVPAVGTLGWGCDAGPNACLRRGLRARAAPLVGQPHAWARALPQPPSCTPMACPRRLQQWQICLMGSRWGRTRHGHGSCSCLACLGTCCCWGCISCSVRASSKNTEFKKIRYLGRASSTWRMTPVSRFALAGLELWVPLLRHWGKSCPELFSHHMFFACASSTHA